MIGAAFRIGIAKMARKTLPADPINPYGLRDGVATCWVTREGTRLLIADMSDTHIINTINMLERKREELCQRSQDVWGFHATCRGDMASYYSGHMAMEADDVYAIYEVRVRPILAGLRAVAKQRGLAEVVGGRRP